jgi:hypothetical protein
MSCTRCRKSFLPDSEFTVPSLIFESKGYPDMIVSRLVQVLRGFQGVRNISFQLRDNLSGEKLYETLGCASFLLVFVMVSRCDHPPQTNLLGNLKSIQMYQLRKINMLCFFRQKGCRKSFTVVLSLLSEKGGRILFPPDRFIVPLIHYAHIL